MAVKYQAVYLPFIQLMAFTIHIDIHSCNIFELPRYNHMEGDLHSFIPSGKNNNNNNGNMIQLNKVTSRRTLKRKLIDTITCLRVVI